MYNAQIIDRAIEDRNLSNGRVAASAGLSCGTVSSIRNGKENVTLPSLKKVADALGLQLIVRFEKQEASHV